MNDPYRSTDVHFQYVSFWRQSSSKFGKKCPTKSGQMIEYCIKFQDISSQGRTIFYFFFRLGQTVLHVSWALFCMTDKFCLPLQTGRSLFSYGSHPFQSWSQHKIRLQPSFLHICAICLEQDIHKEGIKLYWKIRCTNTSSSNLYKLVLMSL